MKSNDTQQVTCYRVLISGVYLGRFLTLVVQMIFSHLSDGEL